jgi:hypothetical protein
MEMQVYRFEFWPKPFEGTVPALMSIRVEVMAADETQARAILQAAVMIDPARRFMRVGCFTRIVEHFQEQGA